MNRIDAALASRGLLWTLILVSAAIWALGLGDRPLHHDESIHAYYSWQIVEKGIGAYRYDPIYHGPVLYYGTALFLLIAGAQDAAARLFPLLTGAGLVALAFPLRAIIGARAAGIFALLVAISPTIVYYSRSLRHDVPIAFFTLAAVVAFLHGWKEPSRWRLPLAGLAIGLAAATKEDIYLTGVVFTGALLLSTILGGSGESPAARVRAQVTDVAAGFRVHGWTIGTGVVLAALAYLAFYTSLFQHPENWNGTGKALSYWWGQQEAKRIGGPWWYYLPLEILYEPLIFFCAIAATFEMVLTAIAGRRRDRAAWFFFGWCVFATMIYAWAQEKVPWLLVPALVPQAILAATWIARRPTWAVASLLPLAILSVWNLVHANWLVDAHAPGDPRHEAIVYVQTSYDVSDVVDDIDALARELGTGTRTPLAVSGEATWPLSWDLRDYPVHWGGLPHRTRAAVIIMDDEDARRLAADLEPHYERRDFAIRGWWIPNWGQMSPTEAAAFLLTRHPWNGLGTSNAAAFLTRHRADPAARPEVALSPSSPVRPYDREARPAEGEKTLLGGERTLREPRGVAVAADGRIAVAESGSHRVRVLSAEGDVLATIGGPEAGDGPLEFRTPSSVAFTDEGDLIVADTWNHRLQKVRRDGTHAATWLPPEGDGLWGPRDVAIAPDGRVFVSDTGNKRIVVFGGDGAWLRTFGEAGSGPGQLVEPVGLAIDDETGTLYVADTGNRRVQLFDLDGTHRGAWPVKGWEEFYTEPYLAWNEETLWLTDSFSGRISAYRAPGVLVDSIRHPEGGTKWNRPIGIAATAGGRLLVSDTMNHRLLRVDPRPGPEVP